MPGSERFLLALEGPKGDWVSPCTFFYGLDVFGLLLGVLDRVNTWDENAREVRHNLVNGLKGISGKEAEACMP